MPNLSKLLSLCLILSACTNTPGVTGLKTTTLVRGVDSGVQQVVDHFYSVAPDCSNLGYPEIKILSVPGHGTVVVENGQAYPSFAKDNVRYECNRAKVASTALSYKSNLAFHGKDFFTIQVRFVNSNLRLFTYNIDVL